MHDALRRWVEETTGGAVVEVRRRFTGGSRELWFVDVESDGGVQALVLRVETGVGAFAGTELTLEREATVYRALQSTDVPVPRLVAATPDGGALLLERVPGTSDLRTLDDEEADAVVRSFVAALGRLHRLDLDALELPGFHRPATPEDHALGDVALWRRVAERAGPLDPMLAYGFAWLGAHAPARVARTVLVHGDAGPGNFVVEGGCVTALVDWEMSHVGDPMDDLAWLDFRAGGSGPFADVSRRDRLYEEASGLTVDPSAVGYYAAFVRLRCAVTTAVVVARGGGALGLAAYQPNHHRFLVELGVALAEATGAEPSLVAVPDDGDVDTALHDHVLDGLREEVVPALAGADAVARLRAREAILVLEHLRARARLGRRLDDDERDDRAATYGRPVDDADLADLATEAGAAGDGEVLAQLLRGAQRRFLCWDLPS